MEPANQFSLLTQRRFAPFFWTQFLGAFNDNIFKNALIVLMAFHAAGMTAMDANALIQLCAALFILPFFLFSATAGQIADKFEKSRLIRWVKLFEIAVMGLGALGLLLHNLSLLLSALFLMGLQSTLFGPVKYAILPQHLGSDELVGGNGMVEMGTFVAILLGTLLGGILIAYPSGELLASAAVLLIALLGWLASRRIPTSAAADPALRINWNPLSETWRTLRLAGEDRTVLWVILGLSWFWFYGALFLSQIPVLTKDLLSGNEQVVTVLLAVFSVGVGGGSLLCERFSRGNDGLWLVPIGAVGLTLFGIDIFFALSGPAGDATMGAAEFIAEPGHWRLLGDLLLLGVSGGLYTVPLYALMQRRSRAEVRSRIVAANNIWNALFMVVSAIFAAGLGLLGMGTAGILLAGALLNGAAALLLWRKLPEVTARWQPLSPRLAEDSETL